jgi:hypothetical protein
MPFPVMEGDGGKPVIKVEVPGANGATEEKKFFPEQISAMVLEKVHCACAHSCVLCMSKSPALARRLMRATRMDDADAIVNR